MADQLQLWADAELPDRKRRRVAHEVQEILHAFGVGVWLDKAAWGSSCHRVEEAELTGEAWARLWERYAVEGEPPPPSTTKCDSGVERAWNRLRSELKELGVPHEDRRDLGPHDPTEMRLLRGARAWVEEVFPPWADEGFEDPDDEEDDLTDEQIRQALRDMGEDV